MGLPVHIYDCECGHRYASNFLQNNCVYCHSQNIKHTVEDEGDYTPDEYRRFISNAQLLRITGTIAPPRMTPIDAYISSSESRN